ncbi:MAG: ATP-binding protein, partial [Bdellovibrio bacteriovorus]
DLPAAFETAVSEADAIADRLRREAPRVHDQAAARARLETQEQALGRFAADLKTLTDQRRDLAESWQRLWATCPLSPLPPREMADWLGGATRLREKAAAGDELRGQIETLRATRAAHRQALLAALAALAEPGAPPAQDQTLGPILTPILSQAEFRLRALQLTQDRRRELQEASADLETQARRLRLQVAAAQTERDRWRGDWATLMAELGLTPDASPAEVSDDLQAIVEILRQVDEAAALRARVAGIDADTRRFEAAVRELLTRVAPELRERPLEEAVTELHQRLGEQREAKSRLDVLKTQAGQAEGEITEAEADLQAADLALAELCRQAGREHPDQLPTAEERSRERRQSELDLRTIESELIEGGDGLGLDALETEARSVDRDTLMQELAAVSERIERELRPERERQLEAKLNAERDFAAMAGGDQASNLAEEAEQTLASLRAHAERYIRVRLAGRVLRDAIEHFRRAHRDPILTRASGYFATLTRGSFASVETDFDEADQPVLVGVRPGGERLRVEAMSTGTRDQLYLALRLATLDQDLAGSEPLPFVVDDILIQFDDRRAQATLEALADLSARTQVILFTHHARVVEQARAIPGPEGRVFVHELA